MFKRSKYPTLSRALVVGEEKKNNAYIHTEDLFLNHAYDAKETVDLFGEDMLEEYGSYVEPALLERYKKCWTELKEISEKLGEIQEQNEKKRWG
jgi:fructose 1,6-bisphosphatase